MIRSELISRDHNNSLAAHFETNKTQELIVQKYYLSTFIHNVELYVKECDVFLTSKAAKHKPYGNFLSLPILSYQWKYLLIDFVTGLSISINWKNMAYGLILMIVDCLIKMVHQKPVKDLIDAIAVTKVIIDIVVRYHGLPAFIVSDWRPTFTSKFWFSLYYLPSIKQIFSTTFQPAQTVKPRDRTAPWRPISDPILTTSQITWYNFCPWRNLPTIM